ncbi:MAG: Uma2 family endonuclease [Acetobacteraceae bacterium]|nr:Uma2 family endonuclease [Acetobacteraceae bacterium]
MTRLSRAEFREWSEAQTRRYERVDGEPVAMAPERVRHNRIKARLWAALDRAVTDAGVDCEVLTDGVTVEIDEDTDHEPDAVVNFGPKAGPDETVASRPVIVAEVLPPGTQSVDTSDKLVDYFRVATVQHYLIVRSRRREVIHYRRAGEGIESRIIDLGAIHLDPPGITIDLDSIYPR